MTRRARLASFALLLALVFGGSYAIGAAVGPFEDGRESHDPHGAEDRR